MGRIERGAEPTMKFGLGPRISDLKISRLSVQQTWGFNNPDR
jgi:hypothetical protein